MTSISVKTGDRLTIGENTVVQVDRTRSDRVRLSIDAGKKVSVVRKPKTECSGEEVQDHLRQLAQEVMSDLSMLDPSHSKELLGSFVSELFMTVAEQERNEMRHQRQAEGIAAAKARGVRFGRSTKPLPDNFEECYQAWRDGEMTLTAAAETCGMVRASFSRAAMRREQSADCAV